MIKHHGKTILKSGKYKIISCQNCGFIHASPIPKQKDLDNYYKKTFYEETKPDFLNNYLEDKQWIEMIYGERLKTIERLLRQKSCSLLDIGSGLGFFLKIAKKRGWKILGVEPSNTASEYANKNGLETINQNFEKVAISANLFDVISIINTFEHLRHPKSILNKSYQLLKTGGILLLVVSNDFNPLQEIILNE